MLRRMLIRTSPPAAAFAVLLAAAVVAAGGVAFGGPGGGDVAMACLFFAIPAGLVAAAVVSFHRFCAAADVADEIVKLPSAEQVAAILAIRAVDAALGEAVAYACNAAGKRRAVAAAREEAIRVMPGGVADALRRRGVLEAAPPAACADPIAALDREIERRCRKGAG